MIQPPGEIWPVLPALARACYQRRPDRIGGSRMAFRSVILAAIGLLAGCASTPPSPLTDTVQTRSGVVRGAAEANLTIFRGIPYAAPPVGDLRWREPQPP